MMADVKWQWSQKERLTAFFYSPVTLELPVLLEHIYVLIDSRRQSFLEATPLSLRWQAQCVVTYSGLIVSETFFAVLYPSTFSKSRASPGEIMFSIMAHHICYYIPNLSDFVRKYISLSWKAFMLEYSAASLTQQTAPVENRTGRMNGWIWEAEVL